MRSTSAPDSPAVRHGKARFSPGLRVSVLVFLVLGLTPTACVEFSYFGHVRDSGSTLAVGGVEISQQQPNGSWKLLARSDGKGKLNIFRSKFGGGGRVRLRKPGYRTLMLLESEFLQETQFLMKRTGDIGYGEEDPLSNWNEGSRR